MHNGELGLKTRAALIILVLICILGQYCYAQGMRTSYAPYVGGEYGKIWLAGINSQRALPAAITPPAQIAQPTGSTQPSQNRQSDLWNWGGGPKGSLIVNGNLQSDPRYIWVSINDTTGYWASDRYPYYSQWYPGYSYRYPYTWTPYYSYQTPYTPTYSYPYYVSPYYASPYLGSNYYSPDFLSDGYVVRRS